MSNWYVEVEFFGKLKPEQLADACAGAFLGHYQPGVLRLRHRLDNLDYDAAVKEALTWMAGLHATTVLVPSGVLTGPERMLIETTAARAQDWDLLGANEVADRLGVSTTRVRQLEKRPDWPTPIGTVAGGKVYRKLDVEEFARGWKRQPGRPRKSAVPASD